MFDMSSSLLRAIPLILLQLFFSAATHAYPLAPSTWTWRHYADSNFYPSQIAATTDPDGRLRTLFTNRQGFFYFTENAVAQRVHHVIMQSFRPLGLTVLNEYAAADLGSYTAAGRDNSMSDAASLEPRRNFVYSVRGPSGTLAYGGSYRRLLSGETIGDESFPSDTYDGAFIPMTGRGLLKSTFDNFPYAFGGAEGNVLALLSAAGSVQNRTYLTNRTAGDIRLQYYENDGQPNSLSFYRTLSDAAPAGWATSRIITGGSLAITADRRDFYAMITSYKLLPDATFTTEARVFRLRTATTTSLDGDGDPIIDITSVTTTLIHSQSLPAGTATSKAMKYPTLLVTSAGLPKWACWENSSDRIIHFRSKNAVTGGTAEENTRSIANGYESAFGGSTGGYFSNAAGPSFALDQLDRLHLAYQENSTIPNLIARYSREKADGGFENATSLGGTCTGAPAITVGPGDYPYVVYQGSAPGGPTDDKLVIAYPSGLADAYRDDYEDRDKDGRSGLLEFAQGSSDTVPDLPLAHGPAISIVPGAISGTKKPRLVFTVNAEATPLTQEQYQITQGADTINIRLGYSYNENGLKTFSSGGFTRISEFDSFGIKVITADDNITLGSAFHKGFYRLEVTRTQGPP
jgi:hypothetical protein